MGSGLDGLDKILRCTNLWSADKQNPSTFHNLHDLMT